MRHRVLIIDDRPEIRVLVRARLRMLHDVEVVGEGSNGAEALTLVAALAPDAVVLDLEMPVMRGDAAIPSIRELAPGLRILLYTGADEATLARIDEAARPDVIVKKGRPLGELVDQLRLLLDMTPYDVLRVSLGVMPLERAVMVFDTWVGLSVQVLESLGQADNSTRNQLGSASLADLQALMGVYAHFGDSLRKAAHERADEVDLVVQLLRRTAAAGRRALLAFDQTAPEDFYSAWRYEVPADAVSALIEMRERLLAVLPTSSADEPDGEPDGGAESVPAIAAPGSGSDRAVAAVDRAAAAIDRAAAAQDREAASLDELTGTYLRGPGHVELKREISRARRTNQPLALAFLDVDGLKAVNDADGHSAGDQLLRDVAEALRGQLREYDVVVRHGGDEFLFALPGTTLAQARERIEHVHAALASGSGSASLSAGLALLTPDDTLDTLISRADAELYAERAIGADQSVSS